MADNTNTTPLAITDGNGCIEDGQRASYVRYSMENKNLLENKYDIYVGTGEIINDGVSRGTQGMNIIGAINAATAEDDAPDINIRNGELALIYSTQNTDALGMYSNKAVTIHSDKKVTVEAKNSTGETVSNISLDGNTIGVTATTGSLTFNDDLSITANNSNSNVTYFSMSKNGISINAESRNFYLMSSSITMGIGSGGLKGLVDIGADKELSQPALYVHVSSKTSSPAVQVKGDTWFSGNIQSVTIDNNGVTSADPKFQLFSTTGNITTKGNITASGKNSTIEAKSFNATSDERLKTNIKNLDYHDSILDIPVREYDWKESGRHAIGFVAQELQEVYPELVDENENGILSIKETKLVYLLIEEVKKLKKEIENLKKEG